MFIKIDNTYFYFFTILLISKDIMSVFLIMIICYSAIDRAFTIFFCLYLEILNNFREGRENWTKTTDTNSNSTESLVVDLKPFTTYTFRSAHIVFFLVAE